MRHLLDKQSKPIYVCWMVVQMIAIYLSCAVLIAKKRHRRLRIMLSTEVFLLPM